MEKTSLMLILLVNLSFGFGVDTMSMDDNGNMSDCPFTDAVALCPMSFSEHIAIFQSTFRAIPSKTLLFLVLASLLLLALHSKISPKDYPSYTRLKFFFKDKPELPIFNKLLLALSDGILQPKLYA